MRQSLAFVLCTGLSMSAASATPVTLTFNAVNPSTSQDTTFLTLTYAETAGGVLVSGVFGFNPETATGDEWEGWRFDGAGFRNFDPKWTWTGTDLLMTGFSFADLSGLWVDARWHGPCRLCPPPAPPPAKEEPPPCEIVISERFGVPELGAPSLLALGMGTLALFRRFAR